ncbi:hypothetical protein T265_09611 [Opisthorchis viverrini]|uniref:Uncharacterized protein n=1 Tax=Opisthorchis viverrini TaxID=6198 RepID=A0A075A4C5_OPIVI|nr:hypothetical protein T265_09611 [Opisthorchis viverrini]KER22244.1 hypothetical protein T265_09611 [Opisthorchis viverrini]
MIPLSHQRMLGVREFSRLNGRRCSHLSNVISMPDTSSIRRPSNCPGRDDRLARFPDKRANRSSRPGQLLGRRIDDVSGILITLLKCEHLRPFRRENSRTPNIRWWDSGIMFASYVRCPEFKFRHVYWICTAGEL